MNYWVVKARPELNKLEDLLRSDSGRWWSRNKPPVRRGDRVFMWAASPRLRIEGLAEAGASEPTWDTRAKRWRYLLRYMTDVFQNPIGIAELRREKVLGSAGFLKPGPMGTFFPLDKDQAAAILRLAVEKHPAISGLWPELRPVQRKVRLEYSPAPASAAPFSPGEYVRAITKLGNRISDGHRKMLVANAGAPGRCLDVLDLAQAAGRKTENYTYAQYGALGHMIARALGHGRGDEVWTRIVANDTRDTNSGRVAWTLHGELVTALEQLGWLRDRDDGDPLGDITREMARLAAISKTTREQLVRARLGQGEFRDALISTWRGCAVTRCDVWDALRASHIKPWRSSSQKERLDADNGLLLVANLDSLFDAGMIAFDHSGRMLIAKELDKKQWPTLGISRGMRLRHMTTGRQRYLKWHRTHVFKEP